MVLEQKRVIRNLYLPCKRMAICVIGIAVLFFSVFTAEAAERIVIVGIYHNAPKVFMDENGQPAGIFVDVIKAIADEEEWQLQFVFGSWAEGLERLERGEIDLMPDMALTADREEKYTFPKVPVISSWFQVYARKGSRIRTILDLDGKRIAVLARSVQEESFTKLAESFGLNTEIVSGPDYDAVFQAVVQGQADAAITNQFYGLMHAKKAGLEDTAIIFNPSDLYFVTKKGGQAEQLLKTIDAYLTVLKKDPESVYYRSLKKWTSEDVRFRFPTWIKIIGLVVGVFLFTFLAGSVILKQQVNRRTRELQQRNLEFERITDAFVALDNNWRYTYVNARAGELFGRRPEDLLGKHIWTEFPEAVGQPFYHAYHKAMAEQEPVYLEDHFTIWDRWFENTIYPSPDGLSIYYHEITARKKVEAELRKMNRSLRMLSECNESLVRATDENELLTSICNIVVNFGGYSRALVGYREGGEKGKMACAAHAGDGKCDLEANFGSLADGEFEHSPIGVAVRTGNAVFAKEILNNPHYALWREQSAQYGYRSSIVLPLADGDETFGALVVFSDSPDDFDSEQNGILSELAGDLAYGIANLRTREERTRAEEERQIANRLLENIIEFLPDAAIIIDRDKKVIFWNHACEIMTGVKKEEIIGKGDYAYAVPFFGKPRPMLIDLFDFSAEELASDYQHVKKVDDTLYAESFLSGLRNGEGAYLWGAARELFDQDGEKNGAILTVRDVTEQKWMGEALRESEREYRELVMLANSIILRWSRDGRITFLNEFGQKFFGYSQEEIVGRHVVGSIVPASDSAGEDLSTLMEEICANPLQFERNINENMRNDGERVWIDWTNKMVLDENGKIKEILSIGSDYTDRKMAEEQIRKLNEDLREHAAILEKRVMERTAELVVEKERAESADRLKSAFLAAMSHELRTPLNSIIGFTGILLQELAGPMNEEQKKQLAMVQSSSRHLLSLINDVLDISKIESGQLELSLTQFELKPSIEKTVKLVAPMAEQKNLSLHVNVDEKVGAITADQRRLEQILLNLVNNAVKFTEKGRVDVSCRLENGHLVMSVTDTGIGMLAEDLPKLFQPFRQIDTGLTRKYEGTGLGLSICKKLLDKMNGKINVESRLGEGSTFTVRIPTE